MARKAGLLLRVGCKDTEAEGDTGLGTGPWKAVKGPKTGPSKDPGGGPDRGRPRETYGVVSAQGLRGQGPQSLDT